MYTWHALTREEVIDALHTHRRRGLSEKEAAERLTRYGPNRLEGKKRDSGLKRLLAQLRDPMILVLFAAAALSLMASGGEDWIEAVIILVIIVVNALISVSQENNAEKALEALQKMSAPLARVVRDGRQERLDTALLVPGDLILLEAGDLVPADARILDCAGLKVDESALTGESVNVSKSAAEALPESTPLGDRTNMLLSSTVVTVGRASAVVTATGMDQEVGRIAGLLLEEDASTPLQRKLAEISKTLSFLCLSVCAVMFGVGLLQGKDILEMFLTAVSLAVAAIPEGLPAIVTIVLALGVGRMARRGAIVKKLPAVETLGCAGVICSDKTGTLTRNKMTVTQVWAFSPGNQADVLTVGALCNDAAIAVQDGRTTAVGDPTETALVEAALREGLDKRALERNCPRQGEVPFDAQRKLMSTLHPWNGKWRLLVKGAPDVLLSRCTRALNGGEVPLTGALRAAAKSTNEEMAGHALRVLGCAYREFSAPPERLDGALEQQLTFCGLVGMMDPPRTEVKEAVKTCYAAGIRPVMITGDHRLTAVAVARELDIFREGDLAVTGEELDFMPQELLEGDIDKFSVFARVSPEHKMRIVKAWQKRGQVVAMTGDGVNDAPALKAADIGCAMGRTGTDVAKGAADMVLTDDDFSTIVAAVEQGRGIYSNIKKAIHYLLSCNIGEILTIFTATVLGFRQMPLAAVQLLWLNLVTDSLPALALGLEPVEAEVMEEKPRPASEPLFSRAFSLRLAWQGGLVGLVTLAAYLLGEYVLAGPGPAGAAASPAGVANTMAFATLTISQLFHAFDVRSEDRSIFHIGLFSNRAMNRAFLAGMALQLSVLLFPPLMVVFRAVPLSGAQWLAVLGLSLTPTLVCELEKTVRRTRGRKPQGVVVPFP